MTSERWEFLARWVTEWMDAGGDERERMRARLAAEHPDLVDEADSLTAATRRMEGFLETPALVLAAQPLVVSDPLFAGGSLVGPYQVVGLLARGGMGDVYRATDVRLRRDVALKVLAGTKTGDPLRVERFMQEARVTAALDHPNVVRVFDVGEFDGRAYLVTELLEGETLRTCIDRGPVPAAVALRIGVEVAKGLSAAHAAGLVHRDLKPENIFLTRTGVTKLLDFGIAKLAQDETVHDGFSTLTGVVLGTASYLSPEQIRAKTIDARADLFALGSVLFEMLTGRRAFAREHIVETLHAILHDPPDEAVLRDRAPEAVADLVMRLLEKPPGARVQTAAAVIQALDGIDGGTIARSSTRPVAARPAPVRDEPAGGVTRRAAAVARAVFAYTRSLVARSPTLAVIPFRSLPTARHDELLELGLADALVNRLSRLSNVRVLPLTATEKRRAQDPREAGREIGATQVLTGTILREGDVVRATIQLWSVADNRTWSTAVDTEASSAFAIQDKILKGVLDELAPKLDPGIRHRLSQPGTGNSQAFEAYLRGRAHVGKPNPIDLTAAAAFFEEAISLDGQYADAWAGLGSAYKRMPVANVAMPRAFEKASSAANRALEIDAENAEAISVLGTVAFWHEWKYDVAERHLLRALVLQPSNVDAHVFLAHVLSNIGRHREALAEISRARALDPAWSVPRSLEGQILSMAGQHDEAIARLNALIESDPDFWNAHYFRVWALLALHKYEEAIRGCEMVLEVRRKLTPAAGPYLGAVAHKAYALARLGHELPATTLLEQVKSTGSGSRTFPLEALVLHGLGRDEEALAALRKAIAGRSMMVTFLGVDPKWDDLRGVSAFQDILRQANLLEVSEKRR
jgi:tetratricopeptide (TPR) repeat protein/TolB-like protein